MKLLITGANGFIGRACTQYFSDQHEVNACVRKITSSSSLKYSSVCFFEQALSMETDWQQALKGVDAVIHCAARVHVMKENAADPLNQFRLINTSATLHLANQASKYGVKRFIYLSSIKVNGEKNLPGQPFTADDQPQPSDPYAISKSEAESGLLEIAKNSSLQVVILRPPLVYGPGVKGNFDRLIRVIDSQWLLPLAGIRNKRTLVAMDNLLNFIDVCLTHPNAANQVFLVGDCESPSTTKLIELIANARHKQTRLFWLPSALLHFAGSVFGKKAVIERLTDSLQLDISKNQKLLDWSPPVKLSEAIDRYFSSGIKKV